MYSVFSAKRNQDNAYILIELFSFNHVE